MREKTLGVTNNEPIATYVEKGYSLSQLETYYNPAGYFDSVHIFAYGDEKWDISDRVHVHGFTVDASEYDILSAMHKLDVDILRTYDAYWTHLLTLRLKKALGIPSVISLHSSLMPRSILGHDHIFTYTESLKENIERSFKASAVTYLPNRINEQLFRPIECPQVPERFRNGYPKLLSAGRLHEGDKNYSSVIRAMRPVADRYPAVLLLILGDGPQKAAYLELIRDLGLGENVHLLPFQKQEDVVHFLNWCDCFVLVNTCGNVGKALAEALVIGKPIIATGGKGNSQYHVEEGFNGKLIHYSQIKNPQVIAQAVFDMMAQLPTFDSQAIRQRAIQEYGFERLSRLEASVYDNLLSQRGADRQYGRKWVPRRSHRVPLKYAFWRSYSKLLAEPCWGEVFGDYGRGDLRAVRGKIVPALVRAPSWLWNRGVLSILAESFLGAKTAMAIRTLYRNLFPGAQRQGL